jgi:iron-sulfur cluster assembly accessory protein
MSETMTMEPPVKLTEHAAQQVQSIQANEPHNAGKPLRVFIERGGCSGLQYGMVFDEQRADDTVAEFFGTTVVVDPFSANYLRGTVIDFDESLTGGGFKIHNPNARQSCGCGNSFEA